MTIKWKPQLQESDEPLYSAIINALENDIATGILLPGSRLPTHRELAEQLGVAIGTVTHAYSEAEERGLIHGEGRRGTFVGESLGSKSSLSSLLEPGPQVINLSANHPLSSEDPDLSLALRQLARRPETQQLLQYPNPAGLLHHRIAGADWIAGLGEKTDPESVIVTSGAQHALVVVFSAIAEHGDIVLTEEHTYPGIKAVAEMLGLQLIGVPLDREGLLPDAFESLCRKKKARALYCVPTLHNPTTTTLPESRRREIASIAEKYGVEIVEDEINRRLIPDPPPILSHFAPDRSYLVTSASKVIAGGLRVGFIKAPAKSYQRLIDTVLATALAASPLPVEVFATWLKSGKTEKIIARRIQEAKTRQQLAAEILDGYSFWAEPTGYYIWLFLPKQWTTMEFAMEAHRRGVAVAPAETFSVDKDKTANALRVSFCTTGDHKTLRTGLEILRSMLESSPRHDSTAV